MPRAKKINAKREAELIRQATAIWELILIRYPNIESYEISNMTYEEVLAYLRRGDTPEGIMATAEFCHRFGYAELTIQDLAPQLFDPTKGEEA
jgi:hypothetical protein